MDESEAGVAFDESLAVVGRNGTVYNRMRGTAAQDRCHAKTGTLRDVSALAGFCNTTGGERVAFAFLMNRVYPRGARALQDRMTVALARYDAPVKRRIGYQREPCAPSSLAAVLVLAAPAAAQARDATITSFDGTQIVLSFHPARGAGRRRRSSRATAGAARARPTRRPRATRRPATSASARCARPASTS